MNIKRSVDSGYPYVTLFDTLDKVLLCSQFNVQLFMSEYMIIIHFQIQSPRFIIHFIIHFICVFGTDVKL